VRGTAVRTGIHERLPYKEEVAGSNPASPTSKLPANIIVCRHNKKGGECILALLLQPNAAGTFLNLGEGLQDFGSCDQECGCYVKHERS
jgi:hypothetical protein